MSINNVGIFDQECKKWSALLFRSPNCNVLPILHFMAITVIHSAVASSALRADRITSEPLPNALSANLFKRVAWN